MKDLDKKLISLAKNEILEDIPPGMPDSATIMVADCLFDNACLLAQSVVKIFGNDFDSDKLKTIIRLIFMANGISLQTADEIAMEIIA